jgi:hypothetical protein
MAQYQLVDNLYVTPTPAGAYYGSSGGDDNPSRRLLRTLLKADASPLLTLDALQTWTGGKDEVGAMELLFHAQKIGWVEGQEQPLVAPKGALEDVIPKFLPLLSGNGKALLADSQGFYISSQGFPHETAEELSALSADLASLHERHSKLLQNNLGLNTSAWSLVDAAGNSQVGFWPLFIGELRFVLVVAGFPRLNQPALTSLIWSLSKRYGT